MPIDRINWLAVIVGAVVYFLFGWIWFGLLFGKQWMALEVNIPMTPSSTPYIVSAVVALILSFGVAVALSHDDNRTAAHGAQFGVFFGLFFLASTMLQGMMYEGRPLALWAINAGYQVIGLVILGLIHGAWKKAPAAQVSKPAGNA
jgi:biotin transporter BioY